MSQDQKNFTTKDQVTQMVDAATKRIDLLLTGVVVVLFIGFLTLLFALGAMMVDGWQYRAPTYQDLINQINAQNAKIDLLTKKIH